MQVVTGNQTYQIPQEPRKVRYSLRSPGRIYEWPKRAVDIVGALMSLVLFAPVMLGCMAWIKWVDGGPVFYQQWRVGRYGWLFRIYKFRTMRLNAEQDGVRLATAGDPRIIRGCGWMRKSHVDELPQLINILLGHMSLVGPRPERPEIIEQLKSDLPCIEKRLAVAPGLTGLAQISNGYTNDLTGMRRKLAYDLQYLRQRSLFRDIQMVVETVPKFWDQTAC